MDPTYCGPRSCPETLVREILSTALASCQREDGVSQLRGGAQGLRIQRVGPQVGKAGSEPGLGEQPLGRASCLKLVPRNTVTGGWRFDWFRYLKPT